MYCYLHVVNNPSLKGEELLSPSTFPLDAPVWNNAPNGPSVFGGTYKFENKPPDVFFWSGCCVEFKEALKRLAINKNNKLKLITL